MKNVKLFIVVVSMLWGVSAFSQDIIVMRNGNLIQSKVQEITPTEIKYKRFSNPDGPLYTIGKNEALSIVYENGEKEMIETSATVQEQIEYEDCSIPAEENEMLKQKYNVDVTIHPDKLKKEQRKQNKLAKSFYCRLMPTSDAVLADKNIELEFRTVDGPNGDPVSEYTLINGFGIQVLIKNKSSKVVYIDLANTFFVRGNMATPYYVPSSTSNTSGQGNGVSVNVGSVANALGVGGVVGGIASGINVGGGKTSSETTVTYSQRIIAIPPVSSIELEPMLFFVGETADAYGLKVSFRGVVHQIGNLTMIPYFTDLRINKSKNSNWTEVDSKFRMKVFVSYSFEESMQKVQSIKSGLYADRIIAMPKLRRYYPRPKLKYLTENFRQSLYFVGEIKNQR